MGSSVRRIHAVLAQLEGDGASIHINEFECFPLIEEKGRRISAGNVLLDLLERVLEPLRDVILLFLGEKAERGA